MSIYELLFDEIENKNNNIISTSSNQIFPTITSPLKTPTDYYQEEVFDIYDDFNIYNQIYFENTLGSIIVEWSNRMTSCAGVFSIHNNIATIRLSEPLLKYRSIKEMKETLLHEMIHAYCYIKQYDQSDDLSGHGKHFKAKMKEINDLTGFNITVYHSFHDEVNLYAKYIWRCNGKCRNKKPYFGYVKRQMNRPPGPSDKWWKQHLRECGGMFVRISPSDEEIEKMKKEKKERIKRNKQMKSNSNQRSLSNKIIKKKDVKKKRKINEI